MELYNHQSSGTSEERRDDAVRSIKAGITLVGDILKTTLGPKGSMKILQGRETAVTNDGAFILKNLLIDSASAKILVNSSANQDWEEGDGTTSVAVLSSLLLNEAYALSIHPTKIIRGFSLALARCLDVLSKRRLPAKPEDIRSLVRTTLNSKVLANHLDLFVDICTKAMGLASDLEMVEIIKLDGDLEESTIIDGYVLDKDILVSAQSPRILVANTSMDHDKVKIMSSKIAVNSIRELEKIEAAEKQKMVNKVEQICKAGPSIFINRQIVYDFPMQLLRDRGVVVVENADFVGVERLNKAIGGNIISTFDSVTESDLGACTSVANITVKNRQMVLFQGVRRGVASIILFGSSKEILDEAERSIHDALCVLKRIKENPFFVYGGGSTEMAMALELSKLALELKTKESEAVEAFARALQQIPKILADNCGFDGDDVKSMLKNDHGYRRGTFGFNADTGKTSCMRERGVLEGFDMKRRVIAAACETAQTIIKCDGIVKCRPRERHRH